MKKAWTEAALLVALPLGAAWGFSHGYRLAALVLMATAFALIIGNYISAGHEIRRKHQKLQAAAMSDGRYLAENINHLGQLQAGPRGELPAEFLPQLEAVLREACEQNRSKSRSAAPSLSLSPWPSSQTHNHSSTAEQERKEMPLDDIAHCGEAMKLVRLIPKTGMLAELKMFQCARCGHVKIQEERVRERN
jgi:hypothetical protein